MPIRPIAVLKTSPHSTKILVRVNDDKVLKAVLLPFFATVLTSMVVALVWVMLVVPGNRLVETVTVDAAHAAGAPRLSALARATDNFRKGCEPMPVTWASRSCEEAPLRAACDDELDISVNPLLAPWGFTRTPVDGKCPVRT